MSGWCGGGGGQGGCERKIDFFVKIKKKKLGGWGVRRGGVESGGGGVGLGGCAGCMCTKN